EAGPDPTFRWALVWALFNQGLLEESWRASVTDGPLPAANAHQAGLWAQLNCRYAPGPETMSHAIELLERYVDDEQAALAIAMSLATMDHGDDPSPERAQQWNSALELFFRRYPDSPGLYRITFNENFDELTEHIRKVLEPGSKLLEDTTQKVVAG